MSDSSVAPAPSFTWFPSAQDIDRANVTAAARELGLADYPAFHRWSVEHQAQYWELVVKRLGIRLRKPYERMLDDSSPTRPRWLVGARMNIVDSCFQADDNAIAIIDGAADAPLRRTTYGELRELVGRIARALLAMGIKPGDGVAVIMPMTAESVAAYLAVIAAGAAAISIADSFAADEIAARLRIGGAKLILTCDVIHWGAKTLPIYEKVIAAAPATPVVLRSAEDVSLPRGAFTGALAHAAPMRAIDRSWESMLALGDSHHAAGATNAAAPSRASSVDGSPAEATDIRECDPSDPINILFSSGTTGEPKGIPWDHTAPIKCAADAHFHQDLHVGDVACWPTNLGWMMGPWIIFASLINRATLAVYARSPLEAGFGKFVENAGVTMLGVVPSMVRAWRHSGCMAGRDFSRLRCFSSTGECSNAGDMRWLMELAGGRPVIEYCGGTELAGAYIAATLVQPVAPATFSTPVLGVGLVLLDAEGHQSDRGEAFLIGPSVGFSTRLLNRDHDATYFARTPAGPGGVRLRRHGDEMERLAGGYYRVIGRADDTMNLGGIKVGCAEIERVLNVIPGVAETAAVAVAPPGGGPSQLLIFTVARAGVQLDGSRLREQMQAALRQHLNPMFKIEDVRLIDALPRTASNKVMRRELRARAVK